MRVWAFLIAAVLLATTGGEAFAEPEIRNVRFGVDGQRTRIVIESAEPANVRAFTLASPLARLVVEMPRADWNVSGLESGEGEGRGLVESFRFFNASADRSRVVFDLADPALVISEFWLDPATPGADHRLVLDIERADPEQFEAESGFPTAGGLSELIAERAEADYVPPERERRLIVIDAGHGGRDPGAVSSRGTHEADIVLAAARELREQLENTGRFQVVLTRETDVFLTLEQRVAVAAQHRADLFLSIHADAAANRNARGAAVFTLNDRAEQRSYQRAMGEADSGRHQQVNSILASLAVREKSNQSSAFAEVMVEHLDREDMLRTNPHREENFYVLLDSQVPAVLLEMGFMTNARDEQLLLSPAFRERQMEAVADAIDSYFQRRNNENGGHMASVSSVRSATR
jgi:N-acetylmuramoyl-L-alanine amidase